MSASNSAIQVSGDDHPREQLESAVVRFAGDSGDGMQLTGGQFTLATALSGNDLATFPDFPAEIRAPVGTTFGVSSFQINFGARTIKTSGDAFDVLIAMNPAALKVEIDNLKPGGMLVVDTGSFNERNLRKAGYEKNPLEDTSLDKFKLTTLDISKMTIEAVSEFGLSNKEALRCKNLWTLGYVYWIFGRDREPTVKWLKQKFAKRTDIAGANIAALNAGHALGETSEAADGFQGFTINPAKIEPGLYRTVTGAEALTWGMVAGANLAGLKMQFCSYPITPASQVLHYMSRMPENGVSTFQAEDEIAAVCAAIGASWAGSLGVTSSSGPGVALKGEAIGLAVGAEIPLVILNVQRAGPSTGLPTKTEQSDLFQAVYGRNADSPLAVLAASSPADCFATAIEAVRIAVKYMTPVILLSDGYIGNASEPWKIPDIESITPFPVKHETNPEGFHPFKRDNKTLARAWAIPGTPEMQHRIGGIERNYNSGHISYEPENHQKMTDTRAAKIAGIANDIPLQTVDSGPSKGRIAVLGWGSTYGPINRAVSALLEEGHEVAHIHLRHIMPLPTNLGDLLANYDSVIIPEMNNGQLITIIRDRYLIDAQGVNKVSGQPFKISELVDAIRTRLEK